MDHTANFSACWQEDDDSPGSSREKRTQCKYCGARLLRWRLLDARWRLVSQATGQLHKCDMVAKP